MNAVTRRVANGIGDVPSPRGDFRHAVVVNLDGTVVHDPHPSRASLGATIEGVDLLLAINDEAHPLINLALEGAA